MHTSPSPDPDALQRSPLPYRWEAAIVFGAGPGRRGAVGRAFARIPVGPAAAIRWFASVATRVEARRHLAEMDLRMLRDIGLTPSERHMETRKRWWQQ